MSEHGKTRVLFLCVHNSARSQMAAAYLKELAGAAFDVESAGLEPGTLNPLAVAAMREDGIDISGNGTQSVFELARQDRGFHYVISVCDAAAAERCPVFPGVASRLSWSFADPSTFEGTDAERLAKTIVVRDEIREAVRRWIEDRARLTQPMTR